jgi:hypothetical protein
MILSWLDDWSGDLEGCGGDYGAEYADGCEQHGQPSCWMLVMRTRLDHWCLCLHLLVSSYLSPLSILLLLLLWSLQSTSFCSLVVGCSSFGAPRVMTVIRSIFETQTENWSVTLTFCNQDSNYFIASCGYSNLLMNYVFAMQVIGNLKSPWNFLKDSDDVNGIVEVEGLELGEAICCVERSLGYSDRLTLLRQDCILWFRIQIKDEDTKSNVSPSIVQ